MVQHHVSSLLDSKLIQISSFGEQLSQSHILKLRTVMMYQMLMNNTIVVPQGWALDSLPFFQVMSEIQLAIKEIISSSDCPENINDFHPVKMQVHLRESSYLSVLSAYLRRDDCRWSGLPFLAGDIERRHALLAAVQQGVDHPFDSHLVFGHRAREVLSHEKIAKNWSDVIDYFNQSGAKRLMIRSMNSGAYFNNILGFLVGIDNANFDWGENHNFRVGLRAFIQALRQEGDKANSVSKILKLADDVLPPDGAAVVSHFSTFAQVWAAAESVGAEASSPETIASLKKAVDIIQAIVNSSDSAHNTGAMIIENNIDISSPLIKKLSSKKVNWNAVWLDVIRTAIDTDWRSLLHTLSNLDPRDHAARKKLISKMEKFIEKNCKDLILYESAFQRFVMKIKSQRMEDALSTTGNDFLSVAMSLSLGGLGGYLIGVDAMSSAVAGVLVRSAAKQAQELAPRFSPNMFLDRGMLSKRTSILTVIDQTVHPIRDLDAETR